MKKKMIGIFVSMLLLFTTGIVGADWTVGDGHKMHFPQLPDPNGWDVDFQGWRLGDDWECSFTGSVTEIHFWYSWAQDIVEDIEWIEIGIWSNNPGPPSKPSQQLWFRNFSKDEFIIAGPWDGDQGWWTPGGEVIPNDHKKYWQINIMNIHDPFQQQEGVIYWLVIKMPYYAYLPAVGWKTSLDSWQDNAVVQTPDGQWIPLEDPISGDQIDFAFVINGYGEECCLVIESMTGGLFAPTASLKINAVIKNIGFAECKDLKWKYYTTGGIVLWGPKSGTVASLLPGDTVTVTSRIFIGLAIPGIFPGNVTIESTAANNACPPATMTKGLFLFVLLLDLV